MASPHMVQGCYCSCVISQDSKVGVVMCFKKVRVHINQRKLRESRGYIECIHLLDL